MIYYREIFLSGIPNVQLQPPPPLSFGLIKIYKEKKRLNFVFILAG